MHNNQALLSIKTLKISNKLGIRDQPPDFHAKGP